MFKTEEIIKIVEDNKEEAIQLLTEALQSPSPTGSELPMALTMKKWLEKLELPIDTYEYQPDRPCFIVKWEGSEPGRKFLFNGHMDVFPPSDTEDESYNPWSGEIKDGFIYGRGASDMKSGDCAAYMAVKLLKQMGFDPKGSITLNYVSDEEDGGEFGTVSLLKDDLLQCDIGLSMEPTNMAVCVEGGGIYPSQITIFGDGGYAARPIDPDGPGNIYGGEDAIQKAMKALKALYDLKENVIDKKPKIGELKSNLSITNIHAGATNVINNYARRCTILIDRRYLPNETRESVDAEIIGALESVKKEDPTFAYEYLAPCEPDWPAFSLPEDCEMVTVLDEAYEALYGKKPVHTRTMGGAEVTIIREKYGADLPWFGCGRIDTGLATTEECVSIQDYLDTIKIYMLTLIKTMA